MESELGMQTWTTTVNSIWIFNTVSSKEVYNRGHGLSAAMKLDGS
jgi:hypothetical protein